MKTGAPQIIMICLILWGLIFESVKDGEPKTGKYQFSVHFVATLIVQAILSWGGFWF